MDPDYVARFKNAVVQVRKLAHPNIAPIESFGEEGPHFYYVMPLYDGSLRDELIRRERLAPHAALRIIIPIASALSAAVVTVVWKLAQRVPLRLSCVAEELAAHMLLQEAEAIAEEQNQIVDYSNFRDTLFEDLDFEFLYDETYDGIEGTELGETRCIPMPSKRSTVHLRRLLGE